MNRILLFTVILLLSCGQSSKDKMTLLDHTKLAINPNFKDWVLFENGTYIIFDKADTIVDIKKEATKIMKEFGPVQIGGPSGDFSVTHLTETEGWIVSSHYYGMYTYVNPNETKTMSPDDIEIGIIGRNKRDKDGKKPIIIHVNSK